MAKIAHCAPPDVSGLACRTFVPGRARSSNVASPFGFPFRVTKTMTDLITAPLFGFFRQSEEIIPVLAEFLLVILLERREDLLRRGVLRNAAGVEVDLYRFRIGRLGGEQYEDGQGEQAFHETPFNGIDFIGYMRPAIHA